MDFGNVAGFVVMLGVKQVHGPDCFGIIDDRDIDNRAHASRLDTLVI
jgi:hypothetical protein